MIDFNKPFKKNISILGENYLFVLENAKDNKIYEECCSDGYHDSSTKEIHVAITEPNPKDDKDLTVYRKSVARHEIVHAFLHQSGLDSSSGQYGIGWAMNEEMVDWFAIQSPKIFKAFQELDIL